MANREDVAQLELALGAVGAALAYPDPGDLGPMVAARIERERPTRRSLFRLPVLRLPVLRPPAVLRPAWQPVVAGAVALVLAFSGLFAASPSVRQAVERWLGLRGVRIIQTPAPTTLPPERPIGQGLDLGLKTTLAAAEEHIGHQLLFPSGLGAPDEVYVRDVSVSGTEVFLVYHDRPGLPRTSATGVGLLLSEFTGDLYRPGFQKYTFGAKLRKVIVNGGRGFWIEGGHGITYLDPNGGVFGDQFRLAGNVLLWEQGPLTLRIESALDQDAALALARTIH